MAGVHQQPEQSNFLILEIPMSELMDVFCMAGVHQQPEQSNYLADGQPLTFKLVRMGVERLRCLWDMDGWQQQHMPRHRSSQSVQS